MDYANRSIELHRTLKGKIEVKNKYAIETKDDMSLVYTPGVAAASLAIKENPDESRALTNRANTIAVISDGSAVLGLGDIGPLAAMPVMEGKCALFKRFAGIDAIPIVLDTKDVDELVRTITNMAPSFGGINLEDISAPRCFDIERRLRDALDIPVFHDDQHGTAIVVGAALVNALRVVQKPIDNVDVVINGAGSAGVAISDMLMKLGVKNLVVCDINGCLLPTDTTLNPYQLNLAKLTNPKHIKGTLIDALKNADVFIGVSAGNIVTKEMVASMADNAIVFALANPVPEVSRDIAKAAGARIYGAGVSNLPNQVNNALVFPGVFKGLLRANVRQITSDMEVAACHALANVILENELQDDYIIPGIFDERVCEAIANAIEEVANR